MTQGENFHHRGKIYFNTGSENENNRSDFVNAKISIECRKSLISFLSLPSDKINWEIRCL